MKVIRKAIGTALICVSAMFLLIGAGIGALAGWVYGDDGEWPL